MVEEKREKTIETFLICLIVSISLIVGSFGGFWLYIRNSLKVDELGLNRIEELMNEMSVLPEQRSLYLFIASSIIMLIFWVLGFIMYKIMVRLAKIEVKDVELLIAMGSAYTLSFLVGSYIVDKVPLIPVIIITSFIEICVVYIGLFDKIKNKLGTCILFRGAVAALYVALVIVSK
jgi:hypothetical protein